VQALVFLLVLALVGRSLVRNWGAFAAAKFEFSLRPGWLLATVALIGVTYLVQVESWRRILHGWNQPLRFRAAARIWFLANLGRYVPGKVWSVAGMVVLAQAEGVRPWAATASAVAVQAIGIGTAVAVVAVATPGAESPLRLLGAAAVAAMTIGVLAWEFATRHIALVVPKMEELRPLPLTILLVSCALTFLNWALYGASFWALGQGMGYGALPLFGAVGVFALGYVLGLLALFAPGGAVVRESVFVALLTPMIGAGPAIGLSLASRLVLTTTEAAAGLGAVLATRTSKENVLESRDR
jgi:hypothetical protein